jgi:hypothetical protein
MWAQQGMSSIAVRPFFLKLTKVFLENFMTEGGIKIFILSSAQIF